MNPTLSSLTKHDLDTHYPLTDEQIASFREDGFIKLKKVLSPESIHYYGREITQLVGQHHGQTKPLHERTSFEKAFLQVQNLWATSELVRTFAFSKRLARIAAELMGVSGVRMYHDQALYKEPGGGITPMHADQYYWPFDSDLSVTAWIPLQETPLELGPLSFRRGSHRLRDLRSEAIAIEDDREEKLADNRFKLADYPLVEEPYDIGEVSFHLGWTFHRAGPNRSDRARAVMTMIYMDENIRVIEPQHKDHAEDIRKWMPGTQPGEIPQTPINPVLYRAS